MLTENDLKILGITNQEKIELILLQRKAESIFNEIVDKMRELSDIQSGVSMRIALLEDKDYRTI